MRILKPKGRKINIDGVERRLMFTINVIDELQEKHDKPIIEIMQKLFSREEEDATKSYSLLRSVLTSLFNEDAEIYNAENPNDKRELLTEKEVGRMITMGNLGAVASEILMAFNDHLPKSEEDEEEGDSPNAKSVQ